eukprot:CAMPEP_0201974900 /NCGR_PEP_ID=MMETSP0904-20121228/52113_1 /ASSEMBLY_ACC=CAM_ASM_000553 /TAXON_ID=420261 /ORGANISM="Thalassiosira antarctica, Strain CCMP982" /LENGTH=101 /DNA_ID=CAMNT_0048525531 /DNA_START=71 /DNA_END=376 /DNA_ORIENTATION=-
MKKAMAMSPYLLTSCLVPCHQIGIQQRWRIDSARGDFDQRRGGRLLGDRVPWLVCVGVVLMLIVLFVLAETEIGVIVAEKEKGGPRRTGLRVHHHSHVILN